MKLIIGGAYQGKREYAATHYGQEPVLEDFHLCVLEWVKADIDALAYVKAHREDYRDQVILCDDISCGVVPTDPLLRAWREEVGRVLAWLAGESEEVVRMFCGLGMKLK